MKKTKLAIAIIGTIACTISFIISLFKIDNIYANIFFAVAAYYCFTTAVKTYKK